MNDKKKIWILLFFLGGLVLLSSCTSQRTFILPSSQVSSSNLLNSNNNWTGMNTYYGQVNLLNITLIQVNVSINNSIALRDSTGNYDILIDANKNTTFNGNGFVGIGTTTPTQMLSVKGNMNNTGNITLTQPAGFLRIQNGNTYVIYDGAGYSSSGGQSITPTGIYSADASLMLFRSFSGVVKTNMVINGSTGNVGIGTTTPTSPLMVQGSLVSVPLLKLYATTGGTNIFTMSTNFVNGNNVSLNPFISGVNNGGFEIKNSTTNWFTISPAGKVGIGTTAPRSKLSVENNDPNTGIDFNPGDQTPQILIRTSDTPTVAQIQLSSGTMNSSITYFGDDDVMSFFVNSEMTTPKMVILGSSGNVGIGTTSPDSTLDVHGTVNITSTIRAGNYTSADGTRGYTGTCTIIGLTNFTVKNGLITACA